VSRSWLHAPLADTLLVAERLNVARINIAWQDLERQPSKLVDLYVARLTLAFEKWCAAHKKKSRRARLPV